MNGINGTVFVFLPLSGESCDEFCESFHHLMGLFIPGITETIPVTKVTPVKCSCKNVKILINH